MDLTIRCCHELGVDENIPYPCGEPGVVKAW